MTFDTLIIFVKDIEALKPFYIDWLGLDILEEQKQEWLLLGTGASKIGLHKIGDKYVGENNNPPSYHTNTKICFEINEDIKDLREKLIKMGIAMQAIKTFDNYEFWLCDGKDPEGNVFQLKMRKE